MFRGKLRLGKLIFKRYLDHATPISFNAHHNIIYTIPNTKENLGVELLINGVYENDIVDFLKLQIPDGAIFFDIGANIGSIGLPVVKHKQNIRYVGFEASPVVFKYLQDNFSVNKIKFFDLENKLVLKDDGHLMNFYQSELYGKSSLSPTYSNEFVQVESLSLDRYCIAHNISCIDWMKVDVQGFEIFVFEGMQNLLQDKKVKNILFEFEPWAEKEAGVQIGIAKDYIMSMGYDLLTLKGECWSGHKTDRDTMLWAKPKQHYDF